MSKHIFTALNLEAITDLETFVGLFVSEQQALEACGHSDLAEATADGFLIFTTPISDFGADFDPFN